MPHPLPSRETACQLAVFLFPISIFCFYFLSSTASHHISRGSGELPQAICCPAPVPTELAQCNPLAHRRLLTPVTTQGLFRVRVCHFESAKPWLARLSPTWCFLFFFFFLFILFRLAGPCFRVGLFHFLRSPSPICSLHAWVAFLFDPRLFLLLLFLPPTPRAFVSKQHGAQQYRHHRRKHHLLCL